MSEVKDKFSDCENIHIINSNILESVEMVDFPVSFVHIDVDTYEAAKATTEKVWPLLSNGGTILFDDYGFCQTAIL